jgi:hypothetical protein
MAPSKTASSSSLSGLEIGGLILLLATFAAVNLSTGDRCPIPSRDEANFSDLAANLYFGNGYTSTTWYSQDYRTPACFPPLYPWLLSLWMRPFGFGILAARSFDYLLTGAAAVFLWAFARRQSLIDRPAWRLIMVMLILSGCGIVHAYRLGRFDPLGLALSAAIALLATIPRAGYRLPAVAAVGFLLPLTGPALPVYAAVISLIVLIYDRSRWRDVMAGAVGVIVGCAALFLFFRWQGVWETFWRITILHSALSTDRAAPGGFVDRIGGVVKDPSFVACMLLSIGLLIRRFRVDRFEWRSPLVFGTTVGIAIPAVMFVAGVYPTYYSWMAFAPLAVCLCAALSRIWPELRSKTARGLVVAALGVGAAGLPLYAGFALLDWQARDPAAVGALAERNISADDWVHCDNSAYYAVRARTHMTFCSNYRLRPEEKERITVCVGGPTTVESLVKTYGGVWRDTGDKVTSPYGHLRIKGVRFFFTQLYDLHVYRRVPSGSSAPIAP